MRKELFVFLLFFVSFAKAQNNFVPNGGFDTITNCPSTNNGDIILASPWFIPTGSGGTPDLYNTCATQNSYQVPQNCTGWQMPHSGNGYAGIGVYNYVYNNSNINVREYIAVQLRDTLTGGKKYCVEFYASLADSSFWAINRIGACLSKQALSGQPFDTISSIPQIAWDSTTMFSDKTNWKRISGTYNAEGGEKYITIGNFYADNQTDTISHLGDWYWAYFYIDDVSVTDCGFVGISSPPLSNGISLFPNPSDGNFELTGHFPDNTQLELYNMLGQVVAKENIPVGEKQVSFQFPTLAEGVYSYRIISGNENLKTGKLVIVK